MFKRLFLLLVMFVGICGLAFADMGDEATLGATDSSGYSRWRVSSTELKPGTDNAYDIGTASYQVNDIFWNGALTAGTSASIKYLYEKVITNDTLTVAESGKTFLCAMTGPAYIGTLSGGSLKITLPAASTAGIQYNFILANTMPLYLTPAASDTILVKGCSAGDRVKGSTPGTGLSVVSDGTSAWYVLSGSEQLISDSN